MELLQFTGIVGFGLLLGLALTALERVLVSDNGDLRE